MCYTEATLSEEGVASMVARDCRAAARRALEGKWVRMAALQLLSGAVMGVLAAVIVFAAMMPLTVSAFQGLDRMFYGASATSDLITIPPAFYVIVTLGALLGMAAQSLLDVGMYRAARAVARGRKPQPRMLFPFPLWGKALAMNLARAALVGAQLLLLVAPGVIAAYRYAMADYLLAAHPQLGPIEALKLSRKRMKGRKLELFKLQLSYLGWALLCALPGIVAQVWLRAATSMRGMLFLIPLSLLTMAAELCLGAYMMVGFAVFFRRAEGKKKGEASRTEDG